jgi:two-component system nitrate/nitrite response regulator NarP
MHQDDVTQAKSREWRDHSIAQIGRSDKSGKKNQVFEALHSLPASRTSQSNDAPADGRPGAFDAASRSPSGTPSVSAADGYASSRHRPGDDVFPVNVAVADKNPMILAALHSLLTEDKRFNLMLMASDGERFLDKVVRMPIDLGIIGWDLPRLHARDILFALSKMPGAPKIVVYSGTKDPAAPAEALRLGGAGFVSKLSPAQRLLEVFATVASGDMVFPFVDVQKVRTDPLAALTHRERDLLAALESGRSNAQLAREFGISVNTIKFHLRNLFGKLEVRNRTQAICHYLEMKR